MDLAQIDVKTAFLYGEIDEELLMEQPEGYHESPTLVCKLQRRLYGLKQPSRAWNKTIKKVLGEIHYKQLASDHCVYRHGKMGKKYSDHLLVR